MPSPGEPDAPDASLTTIARNRFPFTLACPSFVYPAGYAENVRRLAPFVDEIQLLFFESRPASLPSADLVARLADLAAATGIAYHVHLPTDVYPAHPDAGERHRAVDVLGAVIARCADLAPSTCTVHLNRNPPSAKAMPMADWQARMIESLSGILPPGMPHRRLSVETLDTPFEDAAPVIAALDLSVCMDMGHLLVHGQDLGDFFDRWRNRITVVHLHGVDGRQDHLPLNRLGTDPMASVLRILQSFEGVVCLEVYSRAGLDASLAHLAARWSAWRREHQPRRRHGA